MWCGGDISAVKTPQWGLQWRNKVAHVAVARNEKKWPAPSTVIVLSSYNTVVITIGSLWLIIHSYFSQSCWDYETKQITDS